MIKNRTAQLIYQTVYLTLGFVGTVASLGIFDNVHMIRWDFYVHFTNISNFLCIGVMLAALIQTARKKEDSFVCAVPILKFIGMLGILLTFLVFNIMLARAEGRDPQANWRVGSLCFHVVLPVMYIADWFVFYERKRAKWYYPIASMAFPLVYVIFLLIQARLTSITIKKVWNTDASTEMADSVTVQLLKNGTAVKTATLNAQKHNSDCYKQHTAHCQYRNRPY